MKKWILLILVLTTAPLPAQRVLHIRGQVLAHDPASEACFVVLMTQCGDTLHGERARRGRFHYRVPHNAPHVLRFMQAGSISKEVVVATGMLPPLRHLDHLRRMEFTVQMEPGDPRETLRYLPVGFVEFRRGNGSIQVLYDQPTGTDRQMVRAE